MSHGDGPLSGASADPSAASLGRLLTAVMSRSGAAGSDAAGHHEPVAALSIAERCALLNAVVEGLEGRGDLDDSRHDPPVRSASYFEEDHRWAGWRADEPTAVPKGSSLSRDVVVRALRRLPPAMRLVLVAREVAGIPVDDLHHLVAGNVDQQIVFLDEARRAYVAVLTDEPAGVP